MSFITAKGSKFYKDNQVYHINGANYWYAMNLGSNGPGGDRTRLDRELDFLQKYGINNLRIMAASEGPNSEPFRMTPALLTSPETYDEVVFQGLDYALDAISRRGMTAVLQLGNFWHWSGGFGQYVQWSTGEPFPYPESEKDWPELERYCKRFYNDAQIQEWYKSHIHKVITRRNTMNNRLYSEDPTIFSFQLANEPQSPPIEWITDISAYIKSLTPNHMVSIGLEGKEFDQATFIDQHQVKDVDYTTGHCWVENWKIYDGYKKGDENYLKAENFMKEFIGKLNSWSTDILEKPFVMEEFGMCRDGWGNVDRYSMSAPITNRNRFYEALFNEIIKVGASGWLFWSVAGEGLVDDGKYWIGDPPHEKRGWYSVYNHDKTTWELVKVKGEELQEELAGVKHKSKK